MRSSRRWWPRFAALLTATITVVVAVAGCAAGVTPVPTAATPVLSGAWVRPPAGMDRPAAGYLTIANPGGRPDSLVAASSSVASTAEIHKTATRVRAKYQGVVGSDDVDVIVSLIAAGR